MALSIDGQNKIISLDTTSSSAEELWSRWVEWYSTHSNWLPAFKQTGGDVIDVVAGIYTPVYIFLMNGWRVRPMESHHTLTMGGNLVVEGGGDPIISTLGNFNVLVKLVVPIQAQLRIVTVGGNDLTPALDAKLTAIETAQAGTPEAVWRYNRA